MTRLDRVRRVAVTAVAALVLSSCTSGAEIPAPAASAGASGDGDAVVLEAVEESPREDTVSALRGPLDDPVLPAPLVDPARVVSGGPPPDGIPPIDEPRFLQREDVDWLAPDEPVIALEASGQSRAYPVQVMVWHEIVNDTVGGRPVSVTYCPLCNSALAFDRRLGERVLTFGTSGKLYLSDLVMYDRQTESLWSQIEGRAIAGVLAGETLTRIPVQMLTWTDWQAANPDGWVLSRDTGVRRNYGQNPYVGYDEAGSDPFLFDGIADPRLPPKERVLGVGDGVDPVAVPLAVVAEDRVVELQVDGSPVVLWGVDGLRSALDSRDISEGRRIAATGAFDPVHDGQHLTFRPQDTGGFVDDQTGSGWNIQGDAVSGPLAGASLDPVGHLDTFWFAWAAFHPDTRLVTGGP